MKSDQETSPGKETYVHGYEEWTRTWMSQRSAERDLAFALPYLKPGMEVLDCGCGPGSITAGVAKLVSPGRVVGMDLEPRQLEFARALAAERQVTNLTLVQGSVYELPFPDASFDFAYAHFVLEHISDPPAALREMRRVLRPGGMVAVKDPYYPAFTFRPQVPELSLFNRLMDKVRENSGASGSYSVDLRAHLLAAGFARTSAVAHLQSTAGSEDGPNVLPMILRNQVREDAFRRMVLDKGWASEAELDGIAAAAEGLGQRPDLFGFVVFVCALGWTD